MNDNYPSYLELMVGRYPALSTVREDILAVYEILKECYQNHGKLLVAGNGGSAADAEHIVGELMKTFKLSRKVSDDYARVLSEVDAEIGAFLASGLQEALPAIALDGHFSLATAVVNDGNPQLGFAQQVNGYGAPGDVFLGISTSGNSQNVIYAAVTAKAKGMKVIGLTGKSESLLSKFADVCIRAPENETYLVQELHLPIYHCLCAMLEECFFGEENREKQ